MQGVTREWAAQQRAQLDTLWLLATDTHTLLIAAADTEPNAAAKVRGCGEKLYMRSLTKNVFANYLQGPSSHLLLMCN